MTVTDNKFTIGTENIEIKAIFELIPPATYTVTYDANGGSGTMENGTATEGQEFTLPANGFTAPDGQQFKEWDINGTMYQPGDRFTTNSDITVKAVWEDIPVPTYTVTVTNDGNGTASANPASGEKAQRLL